MRTKTTVACTLAAFMAAAGGTAEATGLIHTEQIAKGAITLSRLAPGVRLAGNVALGDGAFLGIGVVAIPGVRVGAWTTAGAGAAIVHDLPDAIVAIGVPARPRPR